MSFFNFLGHMAGGAAQAAQPYINEMAKDKFQQERDERDSKKITDAMAMATQQHQIGTDSELAQVNDQIKNYQMNADARGGVGAEDRHQELAAMEASKTNLERKASLVDQLANTDPMAARGMYTAKLLENGMKVDKNTMGVFDLFSKDITQGKADLIAAEDRTHKMAQTKAQGVAVTEFFKNKPQYAPIFTALKENGVAIEDAAPLLSTLIKDENSTDSLINKMLLGQMNIGSREKIASEGNDTRELIASQGNDTKSLIAAIHGANSSGSNEWKQIMRQDKLDKIEQDRIDKLNAKKESDAKYLLDRKSDRTVNADKVLSKIPGFDKMKSSIEKQKAIDGYIKSGIVPTIKQDDNGVHYASFGTKSNPTKTAPQADIIKQIKASYPNATQEQIGAFLKQKGY